ncbi:zinc finger domain-containing protein [Streptomyces longwoodensis]|uniref:zinc finger domain-containing protein n=1 Tax=Streptomyces longwoodensis TaxID=68231 RepID=UPI0033E0CD39
MPPISGELLRARTVLLGLRMFCGLYAMHALFMPDTPALAALRAKQEPAGSAARTWHAEDVTCPKCQARPNSSCTPDGPHQERVEWAQEFTRKLWG